jgi:7-cyano-7-deazaguanine synthase
MHHRIPAVVLLSGGIDSATVLALANEEGYSTHVLTFDYGQTHRIEIEYAKTVVEHLGCEHHTVLNIDFGFADTPLLDGSAPQYADRSEIPGGQSEAFMPGRNAVFLAHGLAFAEQLGARDLFIGPNADDALGFADCRPIFVKAFERLASLSTGSPFRIHAPLIEMTKAQIVSRGRALGIDYPAWTWSCYRPAGGVDPCGQCEACLARIEALLA